MERKNKRVKKQIKMTKVNKKYTHFAVSKATGKIVNGWETISDIESLKHYAKTDLEDMDLNPKDFKILSKQHLIKNGIDPFNWENWGKGNENKAADGAKIENHLGSPIKQINDLYIVPNLLRDTIKEWKYAVVTREGAIRKKFMDIDSATAFAESMSVKKSNVWTEEQQQKVNQLDADFEQAVIEKGIERNSKDAADLWRSGGFQQRMGDIFGKKYADGGTVPSDLKAKLDDYKKRASNPLLPASAVAKLNEIIKDLDAKYMEEEFGKEFMESENKGSLQTHAGKYGPSDLPKDGSEINILAKAIGDFPERNFVLKYDPDNFHFKTYLDGQRHGFVTEKAVIDNLNNGIYVLSSATTETTPAAPSKEVLTTRLKLLKKMVAKKPTATLKTRIKIVEKMLTKFGSENSNEQEWEIIYHTSEQMKKTGKMRGNMKTWIKAKTKEAAIKLLKKEDTDFAELKSIKKSTHKFENGGSIGCGCKHSKYDLGGPIEGSSLDSLIGKRIHIYTLGVTVPMELEIINAKITPTQYLHRDVTLILKGGYEEKFPLREYLYFLSGKEVKIKDSQSEPYIIQLVKEKAENGAKVKWATGAGRDVYSFLTGDEVYVNGVHEPFGMVTSIGNKNVMVKRYKDNKIVPMAPTKLWVGKNIPHAAKGAKINKSIEVGDFVKVNDPKDLLHKYVGRVEKIEGDNVRIFTVDAPKAVYKKKDAVSVGQMEDVNIKYLVKTND